MFVVFSLVSVIINTCLARVCEKSYILIPITYYYPCPGYGGKGFEEPFPEKSEVKLSHFAQNNENMTKP